MSYYRLPTLITICIALFGATPNFSQNRVMAVAIDADDRAARTIAKLPSYESYMQEGQNAIQSGLYQQALDKFQAALKLRPNDKYATKALEEATTSSYNDSMRKGYAASAAKDYQTALQNFKQALKLKPQAFHATEAVRNISQYIEISALSQNSKSADSSDNNILQANNRFLWLGLGVTSAAVLIALFFFQKKLSPSPNITSEREEQYETSNIINTQAELITPLTTVATIETPSSAKEILTPTVVDRPDSNHIKPQPSNNQIAAAQHLASLDREQSKAITKLDVVTELVKELEHPSPAKRRKAIWELAQRADSRAMKPLVELMIEADSQERSLILEAVSQIASRTLKPMNKALAISLEDPNSQVRKNAIRDLTRVYDLMTQVSQRLSYSLDDPDNEVRETAKWALKQLNQLPASVKLEDLGKEEQV
jgi:tetratricopeptide (TPR) repeat protein